MSKHKSPAADETPPAPPADVMTPDAPERAAPVYGETKPAAKEAEPAPFVPTARDGQALFEALAKVARLRGYNDHHLPPHAGDIDTRGVSPEVLGVLDFVRGVHQ